MSVNRDHGGPRIGAGAPRKEPTRVVRLPVPLAEWAQRLAGRGVRMGDVGGFFDLEQRSSIRIPMMLSPAVCGFPSPADDYIDGPLDFNELLVRNPSATFAVRIKGDSMTGVGILDGDIGIVDRSISATHNSIVLAIVEGEFTIKRYWETAAGVVLHPENPDYPDIRITPEMDFEVWGRIKHTIRMF
jgi:DNA polymerase V